MANVRRGAPVLALLLITSLLPQPAYASTLGPIVINDGAQYTNDPLVTLHLPPPTDDAGLVRLSNNGISWSAPAPWVAQIEWSLTEPSTGGSDADGTKTVHVEYDDGSGTWADSGAGSIVLDRTPPNFAICGVSTNGWVIHPCWNAVDYDFGIAAAEFRLDDGPWTPIGEVGIPGLDARSPYLGGSWETRDRQLCYRPTDPAGNVGEVSCWTFSLTIPEVTGLGTPNENWDVRFELPRPPVTGELFTIRPIFPVNFPDNLPDTALCKWIVQWSDKDNLGELPNENYGSVRLDKLYNQGGCNEWTFTLPYTPGLHYQFSLQIWGVWYGNGYHYTPWSATTIKATEGTRERGMPHSTHAIAYIVPDQFVAQPGDPVTYRLYYSTGAADDITSPKTAWWWAHNNECEHNIGSNTPNKNLTFTYVPDCQGPWETGWTWEDKNTREYLRAEFDPPADKAPPTVSAPQAVFVPHAQVASTIPATLSWNATDPVVRKVSTGVVSTQLQVSRNAGAWKNVSLPSTSATSVGVNLQTSGSYRFRARATDKAGNRSAWSVGPVLRPRLLQQGQASLGPGWSTVSGTSLSGGSAVASSVPQAIATLSFQGRGVTWIGSVGPQAGIAQVYVDGVLTETVDLSAPANSDRRVLFARTWAGVASHTVRIKVLGTYGRPRVTVDGFVIFAK